ncbi:putative mitochondrial GTPase [Sphaerosporella brunnea]|uniref:Putative mitochondrial GTPase n=1 Tax=Sphaerosporella brunnea TaxID=1250544 RepID=A0A5J5EKF1_9PEZI|nr:putative mitochondrial GTPase [Sphaerosporella brunnea]
MPLRPRLRPPLRVFCPRSVTFAMSARFHHCPSRTSRREFSHFPVEHGHAPHRHLSHQPLPSPEHSSSSSPSTTIYALSTPPGKSAIAVVRASGPAALEIYTRLTTPLTSAIPSSPPKPRYAVLRPLHHPQTHELLDPGALCLYFPGPNSHTGEDVLELHLHGGPAIIRAVLSAIPLCGSHIRYAEPGEFTRRAFHNERLSLPEIEALGETLDATTEEQRKRAVRGNSARLAERYEEWRRLLVQARGELEALIDFAEDQHFEESNRELVADVVMNVQMLREKLWVHIENSARGELLKSGISLSLVGAPNAGKSSLLNRIVKREAVIVSDEAGTTRDVVDLAVDVGGFMVVLGDTAGLRVDDVSSGEKVGRIEEEGIRRARERAMSADVVVAVVDIVVNSDDRVGLLISPELVKLINEAEEAGKEVVVVVNKTDLHPSTTHTLPMDIIRQLNDAFPNVKDDRIFGVSSLAKSEHGIKKFLDGLTGIFHHMTSPISSSTGTVEEMYESIGATERQRLLVEACNVFLGNFLEIVGPEGAVSEETGDDVDVVAAAEELRGAAECLGRITGRGEMAGDVEEVLGVVFEKFCVGK